MLPFRRTRLIFFLSPIVLTTFAARAEVALVKAERYLTLRDKAAADGAERARLERFEPVKVIKRQRDWAQVQSASGVEGWVMAAHLTETAFVSVDGDALKRLQADKLNARRGPGVEHPTLFRYDARVPLYVLNRDAESGWLYVMDYDGDKSWVSSNLVSLEPYIITQLDDGNSDFRETRFRQGQGTDHPVAFTSERGVVYRVLEEKDGWLRVEHEDKSIGWVSARIVFGWFDAETDHLGFPKDKGSK
jgi:SH3-like domain-containing protein